MNTKISKVEHAVHIVLTLLTSGLWLVIYLVRIYLSKFTNVPKPVPASNKQRIMDKVDQINSNQKPSSGTATYEKRTFASEEEAEEDDWYEFYEPYSFLLVGESYKRDKLMIIIEKHNAFQAGELELDAVLKMESDNKFDPTAVGVFIENKPVGYVPSDYSLDVTSYMDDLNVTSIKVKAMIGWDTSNPSPAIGVRLDWNF